MTVIATIRSLETETADLKALPTAAGNELIILPLASGSDNSALELIATILDYGIKHIDVLIANAGSGSSFLPTLKTGLDAMREDFEINTLGPLKIFQAAFPLLEKAGKGRAKFVLVTSSLGSIGEMEYDAPTLSYGVSKAGANYLVRKVNFEHKEITTLAVHPGWVKTANGQAFADSIGVDAPPMTLEESVKGVLAQIDGATRETTSGLFVSYDGTAIKW